MFALGLSRTPGSILPGREPEIQQPPSTGERAVAAVRPRNLERRRANSVFYHMHQLLTHHKTGGPPTPFQKNRNSVEGTTSGGSQSPLPTTPRASTQTEILLSEMEHALAVRPGRLRAAPASADAWSSGNAETDTDPDFRGRQPAYRPQVGTAETPMHSRQNWAIENLKWPKKVARRGTSVFRLSLRRQIQT